MKVFSCKNQEPYGGGLILVTANTIEEAFLTAAMDKNYHMFDWVDNNGNWCKPDGNIDHCISHTYPFKSWFEVEHLSTDLTKAKVIIENHYTK